MSAGDNLATLIQRGFIKTIQPTLNQSRRSKRFADIGVDDLGDLPVAQIDLMRDLYNGHPAFASNIFYAEKCIARYLNVAHVDQFLVPGRLATIALIDLADYPDFESYEKAVHRLSGKAVRKKVRRARRLGYSTRLFNGEHYLREIGEIKQSKLWRSGGLMMPALLGALPPASSDLEDDAAIALLAANKHCELYWGVFHQDEDGRSTLRAFMKMQRSGNFMFTNDVMGHGDHLRDGVMALMQMNLMEQFYDAGSALGHDLRHFAYGGVEHGGDGLFKWKLSFGFKPYLLHHDAGGAIPAAVAA